MKGRLLILTLFIWIGAFAQSVPNTTTFSLQDVCSVVGGDDLQEAFSLSVDAYFDPAYKGSKNNLLNFRNYTIPSGCTTCAISVTLFSQYAICGQSSVSVVDEDTAYGACTSGSEGFCTSTGVVMKFDSFTTTSRACNFSDCSFSTRTGWYYYEIVGGGVGSSGAVHLTSGVIDYKRVCD